VCIPIWGLLPVALLFLQKVWNWINGRGFVDGSTKVNVKPVFKPKDRKRGDGRVALVASAAELQALRERSSRSARPLLLQWSSPTCGPCKRIWPTFEALASQHTDLIFAKVPDSDAKSMEPSTSTCGVASYPTFQLYYGASPDSACLDQFVGGYEQQLRDLVAKYSIVETAESAMAREKAALNFGAADDACST
jgi:thiol-disulfide isomerase/thioredoxin